MSVQVWRRIVPVLSLLALAGCSTAQTGSGSSPAPTATAQPALQTAANTTVVEGGCPQVFLRDGTAYYRTYAKGGNNDASKVVYQASFAETSRACTLGSDALNITVVAKGRLVTGPMGGPGRVVLPIRVEVMDGETSLYAETSRIEAEVPADGSATQFVFRKDNVSIPGGAGKLARVYVSFDETPAKAAPKRRKK